MSADKRTVATDALATLGTIIDGRAKRDAVHVAVLPVKAYCDMPSGCHVGLCGDGKTATPHAEKKLGVVDPFLPSGVKTGERFWLFLYPRLITSLRHVWRHPDVSDELVRESASDGYESKQSEEWLEGFCGSHDCPRWDIVKKALLGESIAPEGRGSSVPDDYPDYYNSFNDGEYLHFGGYDAHGGIPSEFWDHVENALDIQPERAEYFSCSC